MYVAVKHKSERPAPPHDTLQTASAAHTDAYCHSHMQRQTGARTDTSSTDLEQPLMRNSAPHHPTSVNGCAQTAALQRATISAGWG
jgi:hypothetical protein